MTSSALSDIIQTLSQIRLEISHSLSGYMLEAKNLGCIRGDRRLFAGLNFKVPPGELIELHGPNGTGKTSLLRIMCGLAEPAEGEIRWQNKTIRALAEEYYANIVYLAHQ